jgi:uncharacterized protein (DUF342 family)
MNGPTVTDNDLLDYMKEKAALITIDNVKIKRIMDIKLYIEQQCKNYAI